MNIHRLDMSEKLRDQFREFGGVLHLHGQNPLAVLIQNRGLGILENDVAEGITGFALFLDFLFEIVGCILGLPVPSDEVHFVLERPIGTDSFAADFLLLLGNERPAVGLAGIGHRR